MNEGQSRLIGIAGGSCSGKTTVIEGLTERLGKRIAVVSFDEYFVGTEALKDVVVTGWESPTLYNYGRFVLDLIALKCGQVVELSCNSRESAQRGIKTKRVAPSSLTVVEGFLIYHEPAARQQFDTRIFIDISEDEMIRRRLARSDGTGGWNDPDYINNMLIPGYRKYVLPQREFADILINGAQSPEQVLTDVALAIE